MVGSRGGGKGSRAKRQQTQPLSGPHRRQTAGSIQRSLDLGSRRFLTVVHPIDVDYY